MTFLQAGGTGIVSAEELARAQDRESLQALLATTLRRRESLTRQLAALQGASAAAAAGGGAAAGGAAGAPAFRAAADAAFRAQRERRVLLAVMGGGICLHKNAVVAQRVDAFLHRDYRNYYAFPH